MFHKIESAKDKILEADPNLEKSLTISMTRHRKKCLLHIVSYTTKRRQALFELLLGKFYKNRAKQNNMTQFNS